MATTILSFLATFRLVLALLSLLMVGNFKISEGFSSVTFPHVNALMLPYAVVTPSRARSLVRQFSHMEDEWESLAASNNNNRTAMTGGYKRIEDWHVETHDPNHMVEHLKRERARWAKTFEGLGSDGI
jgi:hypothetical protein